MQDGGARALGEEWVWDDVHGGEIPPELVKAARREKVEYMRGERYWN